MLARLVIRLLINAVALWAAASWIDGIVFDGTIVEMIIVAGIFGLINAIIKPIINFFAFPFILLTLGLLTLVINAAMLWLTAAFTPALQVQGLIAAVLGSIVISVVSFFLSILLDHKR